MPHKKLLSYAQACFVTPLFLFFACDQAPQSGPAHKLEEAWSAQDAPVNLTSDFDPAYNKFSLESELEKAPWPDSYWPDNRGGLAWRWQKPESGTTPPELFAGKDAVSKYTPQQLAVLSPAEKYDLLLGTYDYPLTHSEKKRTSPSSPAWFGLCHGWAAASYQFEEPDAVTMSNPDGINIPFAASDVKALLAYAQQYQRPPSATKFLGLRCNTEALRHSVRRDPRCKGVNAGAFHIIMTNFIDGNKKAPFLLDISKDAEVWNVPAYAYSSTLLNESTNVYPKAAPGTKTINEIETTLYYIFAIDPQPRAVGENSVGQLKEITYHYTLELDADGKIIGGEWKGNDSPDFLWLQTPFQFSDSFQKLGELYTKAIASPATTSPN